MQKKKALRTSRRKPYGIKTRANFNAQSSYQCFPYVATGNIKLTKGDKDYVFNNRRNVGC